MNNYEVVLADKYYLGDLVESITLEESLDEIACRAAVNLVVTPDWPGIEPGQPIRVSGNPYGESQMVYLLHPGVVWEINLGRTGTDRIGVTIYDPTIYLAKSEDEYLFPAGQTATQRLRKYAEDWNIEVGGLPDTGAILGKAVYRPTTIYSMIMSDLRETVKAGGEMYRPRMTANGLELFRLGSNQTVWFLEPDENVMEISQVRTLEGAVTQVKILGTEDKTAEIDVSGMSLEEIARRYGTDGSGTKLELPSPVLAVEVGETAQYGTLQRVLQDPKIKSVDEARKVAKSMLTSVKETFSVSAIDVNTIRAGDKVELVGSGQELLVMSVRHELGNPGRMTLELATADYVRRRYYIDD